MSLSYNIKYNNKLNCIIKHKESGISFRKLFVSCSFLNLDNFPISIGKVVRKLFETSIEKIFQLIIKSFQILIDESL